MSASSSATRSNGADPHIALCLSFSSSNATYHSSLFARSVSSFRTSQSSG